MTPARMRRFLLLSLTVLALAVPSAALGAHAGDPSLVRVHWIEQAKTGDGTLVARFRVDGLISVVEGKDKAWGVAGAFSNDSSVPMKISNQFALAIFKNATDHEKSQAKFKPAVKFKPALPKMLQPGQQWSGTFAGNGVPPKGSYVRVVFGWFATGDVIPGQTGFNWLTDHVRRW